MSNIKELISFYNQVIDQDFIDTVCSELKLEFRQRLFPCVVVIWLMIIQRLTVKSTLSSALTQYKKNGFSDLTAELKIGYKISSNTGGYSKARKRLPLELVERCADRLTDSISALSKDQRWEDLKVYLVDGSTWTLESTKELKESFPPCKNQYGQSHWPKVRTVHAHDLVTGVALRPEYGPMYGEEAVGEVTLLPKLLKRIENKSVIVADRLYGTFMVLFQVVKSGQDAVVRLQNQHANQFLKILNNKPGKTAVKWSPSKKELQKYKELDVKDQVEGYFIYYKLRKKGFRPIDLYIFTTIDLSEEKIVELYGLRWHVETDLRDIKSTIRLAQIKSKTKDMVTKEIILGHVAYNLIRNIMAIAGQKAKIAPRDLSFSRVSDFVFAFATELLSGDIKKIDSCISQLINDLHQYKLPKRKGRIEPRKILLRRSPFSKLKLPRQEEIKKILEKHASYA